MILRSQIHVYRLNYICIIYLNCQYSKDLTLRITKFLLPTMHRNIIKGETTAMISDLHYREIFIHCLVKCQFVYCVAKGLFCDLTSDAKLTICILILWLNASVLTQNKFSRLLRKKKYSQKTPFASHDSMS